MATVVSVQEIKARFQRLGWENLAVSEALDFLAAQSIAAAQLIAYLDAAVASPAGFDDQAIVGCPAAAASKITAALKSKGVEAV